MVWWVCCKCQDSCMLCKSVTEYSGGFSLSLVFPLNFRSALLGGFCRCPASITLHPSFSFLHPSLWGPRGIAVSGATLEESLSLSLFLSFSPSLSHFLSRTEQKGPLSENGSQSRQKFLFHLKEVNKVSYGYVTREGENVEGRGVGRTLYPQYFYENCRG